MNVFKMHFRWICVLVLFTGCAECQIPPNLSCYSPRPFIPSCTDKYAAFPGHLNCEYVPMAGKPIHTNDTEQAHIADLHNEIRARVNQRAADMTKLKENSGLGSTAERFARRCTADSTWYQRASPGGYLVGQNHLYSVTVLTWTDVIREWESENTSFVYGSAGNNPSHVGNYTQIVSSETSSVGCGAAQCRGFYLYICLYAPMLDPSRINKPYKESITSCSDCPGKCNGTICDYGGLICLSGSKLNMTTYKCDCVSSVSAGTYNDSVCFLNCINGTIDSDPECSGSLLGTCGTKIDTMFRCPWMCNVCPYSDRNWNATQISKNAVGEGSTRLYNNATSDNNYNNNSSDHTHKSRDAATCWAFIGRKSEQWNDSVIRPCSLYWLHDYCDAETVDHRIKERRPFSPTCIDKYAAFPGHLNCEYGPFAGKPLRTNDTEETQIADLHNKIRARVTPAAADMTKMKENSAIASTAERFARRCTGDSTWYQRATPGGFLVGQNHLYSNTPLTWTDVIHKWESENTSFAYGGSTGNNPALVGNYTQMVSSETTSVGCGAAQCSGIYLYICLYAPMLDPLRINKPYKESKTSCSDCPRKCNGTLCDYGGLICLSGSKLNMTTYKCDCVSTVRAGTYNDSVCFLNCIGTTDSDPECSGSLLGTCGTKIDTIFRCPWMCNVCPYSDRNWNATSSSKLPWEKGLPDCTTTPPPTTTTTTIPLTTPTSHVTPTADVNLLVTSHVIQPIAASSVAASQNRNKQLQNNGMTLSFASVFYIGCTTIAMLKQLTIG